jgi:hypothetical protein
MVEALNSNIELAESGKCKRGFKNPSFFASVASLYILGAEYFKLTK